MSLRGARVLVTGATGFTARYVIPLLEAEGAEVWRLSRGQPGHERALACDITDATRLNEAVRRAQPRFVVHLAGTSNLPDSERGRLHALNVGGTENLLGACGALALPPERVLLASSGYVYGDTGARLADESRAPAPENEYGRSKLAMEAVARRFPGLPVTVVRPFNYSGAGHDSRFLVPRLVSVFRARTGGVSFVQSGIERDFSDVRWVAAVYVALLSKARGVDCVNICSGIGVNLADLVRRLANATGYRPPAPWPVDGIADGGVRRMVGSPARLDALVSAPRHALDDTLRWMLQEAVA